MDSIVLVSVAGVICVALALVRIVIVAEHERVVAFRGGRFARVYGPGVHVVLRAGFTTTKVDVRKQLRTIPGQELLTNDFIGLKATLVAEFQITDPYASVSSVLDVNASIYLAAQLSLRDAVVGLSMEELLAQRGGMAETLLASFVPRVAELGVTASRLELKDMMLPGDLKKVFSGVTEAKQEAAASLERARGQAATMRAMANTARILRENPEVAQLRILDAMTQSTGNTFVVGGDASIPINKG